MWSFLAGSRRRLDDWLAARRLSLLQRVAALMHRRQGGRLVAVTGSCGKSTACWLTGQLLGAQRPTRAFRGPNHGRRMLQRHLSLRAPVAFTVQEISGDRPGAISALTRRMRIDAAIVTAVGLDHYANYRDVAPAHGGNLQAAIAREKGNLVAAVAPDGFACLNADDPNVMGMATRTTARIITFGRAAGAELRAVEVSARWPDRLGFVLEVDGRRLPVVTRFVGTLLLPSILGALAVIRGFGLDLEAAIAQLATIEPAPHRMSVHTLANGTPLLLDDVKAPLWSVERLIDELPETLPPGTTFVLGELSDVGQRGPRTRRLLRRLAPLVAEVVVLGDAARYVEQLRGEGLVNIGGLPRAGDLADYLAARPRELVLVKTNGTLSAEIDLLGDGGYDGRGRRPSPRAKIGRKAPRKPQAAQGTGAGEGGNDR